MTLDHDAAAASMLRRGSGSSSKGDDVDEHDEQSTLVNHVLRRYPYDGHMHSDPCSLRSNVEQGEQTYGEISHEALRPFLHTLQRTPSCALSAESIFYDIGSGLGRLAWYVRGMSVARRVVGVEVNRCRHARAMAMRSEAIAISSAGMPAPASATPEAERLQLLHNLSYVHADIRTRGFADATHAFMTPVCFSRPLLRELVSMAANRTECGGGSNARQLRCLISFGQPLPAGEARTLEVEGGLSLVATAPFAATFQRPAQAFFYSRGGRRRGRCRS